jgi:hypothetical protein
MDENYTCHSDTFEHHQDGLYCAHTLHMQYMKCVFLAGRWRHLNSTLCVWGYEG